MHRHIPTAILLLLMIVLFVAMDETLLPQLLTALAVDVGEPRAALRQGVVLEDICHVMEQSRHCKEHLRRCRSTLPFQKALRVAVPMLRRPGQPLDALLFVTLDHLPLEQQLPQQILRMEIAALGRSIQPADLFQERHAVAPELQFHFTAHTVGGHDLACFQILLHRYLLFPLSVSLALDSSPDRETLGTKRTLPLAAKASPIRRGGIAQQRRRGFVLL